MVDLVEKKFDAIRAINKNLEDLNPAEAILLLGSLKTEIECSLERLQERAVLTAIANS